MSKYQYTPGPRMGEPESPTVFSLRMRRLEIDDRRHVKINCKINMSTSGDKDLKEP
jgi:hypothetical protein